MKPLKTFWTGCGLRRANRPAAARRAAAAALAVAVVATVTATATATVAHAGPVGLGLDPSINLLAFGDMRVTSSDVEGRVLVGGNVDMKSYSVNTKNGAAALYPGVGLTVGNNLVFSGGSIFGGVQVGGSYRPNDSGSVIGAVDRKVDVDFAALRGRLLGLSSQWDRLNNTGAPASVWGTQEFDAAQRVLSVFDIDASMVDDNMRILNLATGATVVINVHGRRVDFGNHGYDGFGSGQVVFNLVDATEVIFNGGMFASLLAPLATVQMGWGVINGQVVVNNWFSSVQVNDAPMALPPPAKPVPNPGSNVSQQVPEPSTGALVLLGLAAALVAGTRHRCMQSGMQSGMRSGMR